LELKRFVQNFVMLRRMPKHLAFGVGFVVPIPAYEQKSNIMTTQAKHKVLRQRRCAPWLRMTEHGICGFLDEAIALLRTL
jgi:hypothetical protein